MKYKYSILAGNLGHITIKETNNVFFIDDNSSFNMRPSLNTNNKNSTASKKYLYDSDCELITVEGAFYGILTIDHKQNI